MPQSAPEGKEKSGADVTRVARTKSDQKGKQAAVLTGDVAGTGWRGRREETTYIV